MYVPKFDQSAFTALHRISPRQWNGCDALVGGRTFSTISAKQIGFLTDRIASDNVKVRPTAEILMPDACGNNDHISCLYMSADSRRVSKSNHCVAAINAKYLMGRAMIVRKWIDPVAPRGSPIVFRIKSFKRLRQLSSPRGDCPFVDQQNEARVVWNIACIGEQMRFRLSHEKLPSFVGSGSSVLLRFSAN
jgi:hypothetical protein